MKGRDAISRHVYPVEWKNLMERMSKALNEGQAGKIRRNLPLPQGEDRDEGHVRNWVGLFRLFCNHVRENEETGRAPLQQDELPEFQRFIRLIMETLGRRSRFFGSSPPVLSPLPPS